MCFSIDLSVGRDNYGKIDNLTLTDSYIGFNILSTDCDKSVQADKDKDYDESKDPLACKIEGNLLSGPQSQVVSVTQSISEVKYEFSTFYYNYIFLNFTTKYYILFHINI